MKPARISPLTTAIRASVHRANSILTVAALGLLVQGCAVNDRNTIGSLQSVEIEVKEEYIDGSLEKALASYQKYLQETPESALTPEAMRRIADLKIKQAHRTEAASLAGSTAPSGQERAEGGASPESAAEIAISRGGRSDSPALSAPEPTSVPLGVSSAASTASAGAASTESDREFEQRASGAVDIEADSAPVQAPGDSEAVLAANAREAIQLYEELLAKYPLYDRNDQVMYQLSRAYEETGQVDKAVDVLRQMAAKYPGSRHLDEAFFRLGEYYFTRKKYLDAEEAYGKVIEMGPASSFHELALYKRGWALFKQDMYEMALDDYMAMLDYKLSEGYDLDQQTNKVEKKHIEDTFRVISLSFSYLGGAESIVDYFNRKGGRSYESHIYSHLGEYYLVKRRYQDAAEAYNTFVERNPLHRESADFSIRVIEIYQKGGFPRLVLESKKTFANTYALDAEYWNVFDINEYGEVVEFLQANLIDLASHYHAAYQDKRLKDKKAEHYQEAIHWYRAYLASFSDQPRAPEINYQFAGLMLENRDFLGAGKQYERTAYEYPQHKNSSEAGYAAVYAYREHLDTTLKDAPAAKRAPMQREIIRSSLQFAETFEQHEKAPQIMVGAVEDLYSLRDYEQTVANGHLLLERFPQAEQGIRRSAWILVAHGSFDTEAYPEAEQAYGQALALTAPDAKDRMDLVDNLAASIYQQGDLARKEENYQLAADHFLRIRKAAPGAKLLATAEYDAAAALITLENWTKAAAVLNGFRQHFPEHKLIREVTKKLAVVYQESGELLLAASEFERIERESDDDDVRREALTQAADLYKAADRSDKALTVLQRYVELFPRPLEPAMETHQRIADLHKDAGAQSQYRAQLERMVRIEREGGAGRTDRTRYLAGNAALVLAEPKFEAFTAISLVSPIKQNLDLKRTRMKAAIDAYTNLIDYQVADVTAASTFYLAEIYLHFSRALRDSERPTNLSALELEEYELALEEQIYPFEERAISVHEKNIELLGMGIYNRWIQDSIAKLAGLVPAQYARAEEVGEYMPSIVPRPEPEEVEAPADES
ncbi:Outer membrane protein assembly factor BamD [Microbulbifer aggregans]|uniref:Outer membrane protein assembly factor BamD n=1 Tax=Microbulbifer aggregans TaxID=1769779 RepID=A0A1C9W7G4_9GAMM|nr:tetratricopeptide repeat protein [Microbulbifer aggregans]AOS97070.1 Outer membrane protein assembly factor BamD [Microbulbifer aggregans]